MSLPTSFSRTHEDVSVDKIGREGLAQLIDFWVLASSAESAEEVVEKGGGPYVNGHVDQLNKVQEVGQLHTGLGQISSLIELTPQKGQDENG